MLRLGLIALPIFALIVLFAPELFAFFFGNYWREAGVYAQILSPWIFLNFIVSPISGVYLIVGKQKQAIYFGFVDIILKFGSVAFGAYNKNLKLGFYAMSITGVLILLVEIIWTFSITSTNAMSKRNVL
jgi:O-antigen/teichoic acid export membrane protein